MGSTLALCEFDGKIISLKALSIFDVFTQNKSSLSFQIQL